MLLHTRGKRINETVLSVNVIETATRKPTCRAFGPAHKKPVALLQLARLAFLRGPRFDHDLTQTIVDYDGL